MLLNSLLEQYMSQLSRLPERALTAQDLLKEPILLDKDGDLEVYYAPHNDYLQPKAKLMIVGITPGWNQMKVSWETAARAVREGCSPEDVCRRAKEAACFVGSMRHNLIGMLDKLEVHRYLGIPSAGTLFAEHQTLVHTTSLLRYPVFYKGKNYTGSTPRLAGNGFLRSKAVAGMEQELAHLSSPLLIPLGRAVEDILRTLTERGSLKESDVLWGFPHPSGANGHRHKQFDDAFAGMQARLHHFATNSWKNLI
ncbi:hypothetical protein [Paenibacillus gansuensis]|uniref:Uracil-DNA glycosylase-like domain-containing protein n=1 Tax=Paenibacillus gansuensis TaxID=306542 RepID=A0ABW5PJH6_9BACL